MADNAASLAVDWSTTQQINLARVEAGSVAKVTAILKELEAETIKILDQNKSSVNKQAKLEIIRDEAHAAIEKSYAKIKVTHGADLQGVAKAAGKGAAKQINYQIGVNVADPVLTDKQLEKLASDTLVFGAKSNDWWQGQEAGLKDKFLKQMRMGYGLGESVEELSRRVRGTKANGFNDGIMSTSRREAEALVRSSIQTISNQARIDQFTGMQPLVKGVQWIATLDGRTTLTCMGLDKLQWRLPDYEPIGHNKKFPGPTAHWNCRSTQIAVTRSWEELSGMKIPALDDQTLQKAVELRLGKAGMPAEQIAKVKVRARASMDGQVAQGTDFETWLKGKPPEFVNDVLGPSRAALWQEGKLTLKDLTDQTGRPLTVKALEAAIDGDTLPDETEGVDFTPYIAVAMDNPVADAMAAMEKLPAGYITGSVQIGDELAPFVELPKIPKSAEYKKTTIDPNAVLFSQKDANPETLKKLIENWDNEKLDPVMAIKRPDGTIVIQNGHHRVVAAKLLGKDSLPAEIHDLTADADQTPPTLVADTAIEHKAENGGTVPTVISQAKWNASLTQEQKDSIAYWSTDYYSVGDVRDAAAGKKPKNLLANVFLTTIDKAPSYKGKVYRGEAIPDDPMLKFKVGETMEFKKPTSTSKQRSVAEEFAGYGMDDYKIIYEIETDDGVDISKHVLAGYEDQDEVVLRGKRQYDVQGVDLIKHPDGDYYVVKVKAIAAEGNLGVVQQTTDSNHAEAAAKMADILANPKGQTLKAKAIQQLQKSEPDLPPVEMLAKAEGMAAEKQAAASKASVLSTAKKKILAGEDPTPAQKAVIDALSDEEKANWDTAINDAKGMANNSKVDQMIADVEAAYLNGENPSGKISQTEYEALNSDQAFKYDQAVVKFTNKAHIDQLANQAATGADTDFLIETIGNLTKKANDPDIAKHAEAAVLKIQDQQVVNDIGELQLTPDGMAAIEAAKAKLPKGAPAIDMLKQAKIELEAIEQQADADATSSMLYLAKNPEGQTLKAKALANHLGVPVIKLDGMGADAIKNAIKAKGLPPKEVLAKIESEAAEKQAAASKASKLSTAKKKLLEGKQPSPSEQATIDSLTPEELTNWQSSLQDGKAVKAGIANGGSVTITPAAPPAASTTKQTKAGKVTLTAAPIVATTNQSKKAPALPPADNIPKPETLKIVKKLGGSTGAQLAVDSNGKKWVVKKGNSPDHVRAEHEADQLYRLLGANVPDGGLFEGPDGPVKVTEFLEGGKTLAELSPAEKKKAHQALKDAMPIDAVFGNWDVVGLGADNVMVTPDGKVWRIDNGGSMEFRAQGAIKTTDEWNEYPVELWTMRDKAKNGSTAVAFGEMDIYEMASKIEAIDWSRIDDAPVSEQTKQTLKRRAEEAVNVAKRARDFQKGQYKAEYTERIAFEGLMLRKDGLGQSMPKVVKVTTHTDITIDGQKWGNLRAPKSSTTGASATPKMAEDYYSPAIEVAIKSIAHKSINASSITEGSAMTKAAAAVDQKILLEAMAKSAKQAGNKDLEAMANHNLKAIAWIEKQMAKGGVPETPAIFKPYVPKGAPVAAVADTRSVVMRWEAKMQAEGIDTAPIRDWLSSQSGNSWTPATQAAKYAYALGFENPKDAQYWEGNNSYKTSFEKCKKQFEAVAKQLGGEDKAKRLFESYHALVQETLSNITDAPWFDTERRAVLLVRTVTKDELEGSGKKTTAAGTFTALRGTTESHSIYKKTSVYGNQVTMQAVPYSRIHGLYWLERYGGHSGSSFLGDGEAEFAANTSGLPCLHDNGYKIDINKGSDASKWGVPIDHL